MHNTDNNNYSNNTKNGNGHNKKNIITPTIRRIGMTYEKAIGPTVTINVTCATTQRSQYPLIEEYTLNHHIKPPNI